MKSASTVLKRLLEGNRRFVEGTQDSADKLDPSRRKELASGQEPFAIILGCSDSRVPAEIVFDQGLGDLFVIRVAGNIVAPSQVGSVEFAVAQFGVQLVVVLGHSQCGAVIATLDELERPGHSHSEDLNSIVNRIKPVLKSVLKNRPGQDRNQSIADGVRANVQASVRQLREGSEAVRQLVKAGDLKVVGAEYSLETGIVDFFDVGDELS